MNITKNQPRFLGFLIAGAIAGMLGGAMMAMFTMLATATYLHMGFFTPLYVIASPLTGPQSMMTAMMTTMHGGALYFAFGPAILGLIVHMMWSALWGIIFGLIAAALHLRGAAAVMGGMVYGGLVMLAMNFIVLPIVGAPNLLALLGGTTFIIGHLLFGMGVGLWPVLRPQDFTGLLGRQARQAA